MFEKGVTVQYPHSNMLRKIVPVLIRRRQIICDHLPDTAILKSQFPCCHTGKIIFLYQLYLRCNRLRILNPDLVSASILLKASIILTYIAVPVYLGIICIYYFLGSIHANCLTG